MHFILICIGVYLHIGVCVCVSRRRGRGGCALLLPRVYLQSVTLMQRNDYFYFRYFACLFPLSGMAPHWPTDYLCGCRHTCLLSPSSLLGGTFGFLWFSQTTPSPGVAEGRRGRFTPQIDLFCTCVLHVCAANVLISFRDIKMGLSGRLFRQIIVDFKWAGGGLGFLSSQLPW